MKNEQSIAKAALWMGGWLALMLTMPVAGREAARHIDVFQLMVLRSAIGLVMLSPLVMLAGGWRSVRTPVLGQHIGRNVVHYGGQYLWLYALTLIPIAQLISIEFTMPIWTALFAVIFLGERVGWRKALSIALGLAGVAVIVRPGGDNLNVGQLYALAAAFGFAISVIMIKTLVKRDSVTTIIFWMLVIQTILGIVPAALVWQVPPASAWPWIAVVAFCGTFSHYCMARAMVHAEATVVVPMDFLRVPLAAVVGYLVYAEAIDIYTALGAGMILFGNLVNLRRAGTARIPAG
ncbi:DMT family transporter [Aquibium oceanicum]|uniref:EamA family transporter n=1 Tax=Aquibium oceanicum TaxID=1670800 RepID=A0A1L3SSQ1_9HYPH|nr:DMT family transporter [Aquibium oceanicum]APH72414.1 EamA family transporter [Aquibium oceanicum]